jgi:hypothetical protein
MGLLLPVLMYLSNRATLTDVRAVQSFIVKVMDQGVHLRQNPEKGKIRIDPVLDSLGFQLPVSHIRFAVM